MKATKRNKVVQIFRLRPELVRALVGLSLKTNITKTRLVELALGEYLGAKR